MPTSPSRRAALGILAPAALLLLTPSRVLAGSFAPNGTWLFDPQAAFTESFESFDVDPDGGGSSAAEIVDDADALDGIKVMQAEAQNESVDVRLTLPAQQAVYRASAWLKTDAVAGIVVEYEDGTPGDYSQMFPTGRMTSDGWMELASAPFMFDGARSASAYLFFFGSVTADAIEITRADDVPFEAPRSCAGVADPSCSGDNLCLGGWCRNVTGWVPPAPEGQSRERLAEYLANRLRFFFGPYFNRTHRLPAAMAEVQGMKSATSRWRFWNSFATAVHRLQDTHTSVSSLASYVIENQRPLNACFIVGDGDLSHATAPADPLLPDVLVSHAGASHAWGLAAGDRLVAIDGIHPVAWMRSLIAHDFSASDADDPESLSTIAERMRAAIPRYAGTITVAHCGETSCGEPEVIEVASIPETPGTAVQPVGCDHRPGKLVASQPGNHDMGMAAYSGTVLGTQPAEKLYGLVFDALVVQTAGAAQISQAVQTWRSDGRGVILDHRKGNGGAGAEGTTASADPIVGFVRTPALFGVQLWRQAADEEGPATLQDGLELVARYQDTSFAWRGGSTTAKTEVPVALLITRDVSFSDLFPYAVKGAPNVRIFGPHPTNGAFSTFLGLSYWLGVNYQVAIGDTIGADGQPLCGHGVRPDEIVVPRQSHLVEGRDTAIERALEWVRSAVEVKP